MFQRRLAFRLTQWPELPPEEKSVHVLRAFSRMSIGPVTSEWFITHTRLDPARACSLLRRLADDGVVECIDFGPLPEAGAPAPPDSGRRARSLALRGCATAALLMVAVLSSAQVRDASRYLLQLPSSLVIATPEAI